MARKYTSISVETNLSATISSSATSLTVSSVAGLLGDVTLAGGNVDQFAVAIDPETVNEEILFVTAANTGTNTLTVVRARAGTTAITHNTGATIKHVLTGEDLTHFEAGVTGTITASSTSTLTNKTIGLTSNTITGTTAQFNAALSDNDFATLAGSETLTNKNLTSGTNTFPTSFVTTSGSQTLTNKTIDYNSNTLSNFPTGLTQLSATTLSTSVSTVTISPSTANKGWVIRIELTASADTSVNFATSTGAQTVSMFGTGTSTPVLYSDSSYALLANSSYQLKSGGSGRWTVTMFNHGEISYSGGTFVPSSTYTAVSGGGRTGNGVASSFTVSLTGGATFGAGSVITVYGIN